MTTEKTLDFQKRKISYRVAGEGPVVVLLHGLPFDGNLWRSYLTAKGEINTQASHFKDSSWPGKFKFITPDLPGSGASEMIDDMSMEGMAEVIKNIIDMEIGSTEAIPIKADINSGMSFSSEVRVVGPSPNGGSWKRAALIGHSMGGYVSLAFAEKYPEYLKGLGLFHSTAYPDSEERKTIRKKAIESIKDRGAGQFLKTMIPNLFSPDSRHKIADSIEQLIEQTNNFSAEALVSYYEAMMRRPDRTSVLTNLKIPMLFIAGKYDNAAPLNDVLKLCHLPEISYFHTLSESGHMGMIEEGGKSNNILNDYLINLS
ncbi:MAG: alpha/beta hydrolase [Bacteroidetes bacterium]|nr:MAG: alpha/beta hydrolase [Bacteroidota bacterium]